MPDCNRITTGFTFQDKEVVTPKKLNKALNEACINLDDIKADIVDNADDIDDLEDILDQLLNPPGGFGLVGVKITQGAMSLSNGVNITIGSVNLVLPPQRKWTHIAVYTNLVLNSSNQFTFSQIRANGVNQPGGSNLVAGQLYFTNNSDDSQHPDHVYRYIPTSPLLNQNIAAFYSFVNILPVFFPLASIYAIGHHEAVLT